MVSFREGSKRKFGKNLFVCIKKKLMEKKGGKKDFGEMLHWFLFLFSTLRTMLILSLGVRYMFFIESLLFVYIYFALRKKKKTIQ